MHLGIICRGPTNRGFNYKPGFCSSIVVVYSCKEIVRYRPMAHRAEITTPHMWEKRGEKLVFKFVCLTDWSVLERFDGLIRWLN